MLKVLRIVKTLNLQKEESQAEMLGYYYVRKTPSGDSFFGYLRPFYCKVLLPIIYPKSAIRKGLEYINLSSLLPHIAPFRGSYEAFSF